MTKAIILGLIAGILFGGGVGVAVFIIVLLVS